MTRAAVAEAPQQLNEDYYSNDLVIKNNAFLKINIITLATEAKQSNSQNSKTVREKSTEAYSGRHYSKEEVIQLIKDYSATYGISEALPLAIARCESGYRQFAKNKSSSASGVYQYLASTWKATDEGKAGLSVFDADANVRAAIKYIASRGHAKPWAASQHCWGI